MYRTFNMGIGMVLVVAQKDIGPARAWLKRQRIRSYEIGEVIADKNQKIVFI